MVEHNHIPEMVSEVVRGKALAKIVEGATVTDESGNAVDLKNLLPDGSIADPEAVAAAEAAAAEGDTDDDSTRTEDQTEAGSESVATESDVADAEVAQEAKSD
jgi:trigger factor